MHVAVYKSLLFWHINGIVRVSKFNNKFFLNCEPIFIVDVLSVNIPKWAYFNFETSY
jgi:hypothetical protein